MAPVSVELNQQIRDLLVACGRQVHQMAAESYEVTEKGPSDYVTSVDAALDRRLTAAFQAWCPRDGLITEENAASRSQFFQDYERLWCIDPLDGTEDFINGNATYAVMVGLLKHRCPVAGWIHAPEQAKTYFGGPGWGVFEAIADYAVTPIQTVAPLLPEQGAYRMLIGYKDEQRFGRAIRAQLPNIQFRFLGSFGLKVMEVVLGRADAYLYLNGRVKVWDTIGPLAMAQAIGLTCSDLEGNPLSFSAAALDSETLAHRQSILIGWPDTVRVLRPILQASVAQIR